MKVFLKSIPTGLTSIVLLVVIAYLSLTKNPIDTSVKLFEGADKVVHALMYFALTMSLLFDYAKNRMPHHTRLNLECALAVVSMLYGLLMEIAQLMMHNGRSYSILDWIADIIGCLAALFLYRYWLSHWLRRTLLTHHHHHHRHHHSSDATETDD